MNNLPNPLNLIKDAFLSQTFWTAVAAIGGLVTLYLIYKQISTARHVAAYEFLRKEDDRFCSDKMRRARSNLATVLLLRPNNYEELDEYADDVLGYFEDLGLLVRKRLAPMYFTWTMNSYYVLRYWKVLENYIATVREKKTDPTYYAEFEYLYKIMLKLEKRHTKKKEIEITDNELRRFLEEELYVKFRPFSVCDMDRILEIERSSFKTEAYQKSDFEELHREHPQGFFVAEILGEVVGSIIGYVSDDTGEFDSLAVDGRFRRLGIGRRLMEFLLRRFREKGIKTASLEVRTDNEAAIGLFQGLGFKITGRLEDYYSEGAHAHVMRMDIM